MATLATLRSRVRNTLGLKSTGTEATLLDDYLNEGYCDVLTRTRCRVDPGTLTTTSGEWQYRMDTDVLAVLEVWSEDTDGTINMLERATSRQILDLRRSTSAFDTLRYYTVEGQDLLLLYPTPQSSLTIGFLHVPRPATMSNDNDTPSYVPAQWHRAIEYYAGWRMADYDDDGSSQVGELYRVRYEGGDGRGGVLAEIRRQNRWQGGRRLAPARVRRLTRATIPSLRSQDSW